ncbi:MAG: type II secretion system protein, partial [Patescibacteria group bacterium]
KPLKRNKGMSYVEIIVVLSIFSVLSSVVIYNYSQFQAKVDIKSLASDIALKVIEAQKSALSGLLPQSGIPLNWKPAYGVYFNIGSNPVTDNKSFVYFVDLDQDTFFDGSACTLECLNKVSITAGNTISNLTVFYQNGQSASLNDLTVSFTRPNSGATIKSSTNFTSDISYVEIKVLSPKLPSATIRVYPSGRIQVK